MKFIQKRTSFRCVDFELKLKSWFHGNKLLVPDLAIEIQVKDSTLMTHWDYKNELFYNKITCQDCNFTKERKTIVPRKQVII